LHPAFGIHPWYVKEGFDISIVERFISSNRTVAVGEVGLDFSPEIETPGDRQIKYFIMQIEIAIKYNLPLLIHCRKAHREMLEILKRYSGDVRGVMHSFSGSKELLKEFESLGFYFSFSGSVTRSHATKYHKNATTVPLDRILFETDAPSISTKSVEARDVEPCHIVEIIKFVSELRNMKYEELVDISTENVRRLFGERMSG
ncbi:MAG: TatD family hydrolase, partial [Myxococcota bacterium]